jgi:hypothetical protein
MRRLFDSKVESNPLGSEPIESAEGVVERCNHLEPGTSDVRRTEC